MAPPRFDDLAVHVAATLFFISKAATHSMYIQAGCQRE
jgi:hypothetical protein